MAESLGNEGSVNPMVRACTPTHSSGHSGTWAKVYVHLWVLRYQKPHRLHGVLAGAGDSANVLSEYERIAGLVFERIARRTTRALFWRTRAPTSRLQKLRGARCVARSVSRGVSRSATVA